MFGRQVRLGRGSAGVDTRTEGSAEGTGRTTFEVFVLVRWRGKADAPEVEIAAVGGCGSEAVDDLFSDATRVALEVQLGLTFFTGPGSPPPVFTGGDAAAAAPPRAPSFLKVELPRLEAPLCLTEGVESFEWVDRLATFARVVEGGPRAGVSELIEVADEDGLVFSDCFGDEVVAHDQSDVSAGSGEVGEGLSGTIRVELEGMKGPSEEGGETWDGAHRTGGLGNDRHLVAEPSLDQELADPTGVVGDRVVETMAEDGCDPGWGRDVVHV